MALSTAACRHRPRIDRQRSPRFAGFSSPVRLPRSMRAVLPRALLMVLIALRVSLCGSNAPMHLASDYIHPCKSAGGPARCRVRIYCQTTCGTTSPPTGVILAWKATPPRSWSNSSLRLRRVVPGAHWRGRPRTGSRHARDCGKIGRGPWRRDGF
jgi:hypothetical protein